MQNNTATISSSRRSIGNLQPQSLVLYFILHQIIFVENSMQYTVYSVQCAVGLHIPNTSGVPGLQYQVCASERCCDVIKAFCEGWGWDP